jgi:glucose/mannose-6-phosphate isomerase
MDVCKKIMERDVDVEEVIIKGNSLLARMFYTIYLGDFTSYYLAMRERVDPTPVDVIEWMKKQLV